MANLIQLIIRGEDQSNPAFKTALANAKQLQTGVKGLGVAFGAAGNLASAFGNTHFGNIIGSVQMIALSGVQVVKSLGAVKLAALASFGVIGIAAAAAYSIAMTHFEKLEAAATKAIGAWDKMITAVQARQDALDPAGKAARDIARAAMADAQSVKSSGMDPAAQAKIIEQINLARDAQLSKLKVDKAIAESEKRMTEDAKKFEEQKQILAQANAELAQNSHEILEEIFKVEEDNRKMREANSKADFDAEQERMEESLQGFRAMVAAKTELWNNSLLNMRDASNRFAANVATSISDGIGNAVASIATGAQSAADAFKQLGKQLLGMLVATAARLVINSILAVALQSAITAASSGMAAIVASAWAAPAALVSLASFGANAIPAMEGIASTVALAQGLALTGGIAHGGLEYVPQESTFLLQKGERVIQPRQNEQLQDMLDRGGSGGGGMTMVTINLDGRSILKYIGQASADGRLTINARAIS